MLIAKRPADQHVTFKNGTCGNYPIHLYHGACMVGDPTAYIYRNNELVWVFRVDARNWREA